LPNLAEPMPVGDPHHLHCRSLDGRELRDMLFNRKPQTHTDQAQMQSHPATDLPPPRPPPAARAQTLIDASVAIVGDLRSEGDVQLDGHICGNVECAQLIVGPDAAITGAVTAEELVVRGRITGTIRARTVILQESARIESDIVYGLLALDEGAQFEGSARRSPNPLSDEAAATALTDLRRMITSPPAGKASSAVDANGRVGEEHRPGDGASAGR
jgi:cytoskeletal protein CcmA (bactofilin family)